MDRLTQRLGGARPADRLGFTLGGARRGPSEASQRLSRWRATPACVPDAHRQRRSVGAGAGEVVAVGSGLGARISLMEGRRLDAHATESRLVDWAGLVAGPKQLEADLGAKRSTLQDWCTRGAIVGLRQGTRRRVYPRAQFRDGRPLDGVAEVPKMVRDERLAWLWRNRPDASRGGVAPIDRLQAGETAGVIEAASGLRIRVSLAPPCWPI